ncbi:MAG: dephospho-CoA kinase [Gemmatimonadota bacterium]
MEAFLEQLIGLLIALGPWIVFATTFTETAVFIGLLIPAEATVIAAAVLAVAGEFSLRSVFAATFFGALLGDQTGYLLGRFGGNRVVARGGIIARLWHRYEPVAARLFRRHAALSVSMARFISFVRTLMPWFAGMSAMRYPRFFIYDFIGVLGWAIASLAIGYLAGESWRVVAGMLGRVTAYILIGLLLLAGIIALHRKRQLGANQRNGMLRIGLTGNIASGKSSVADVWRSLGAAVIDADVLARRAVEPGTPGFRDVVREFGPAILSNGEIDRARLRDLVFADAHKRKRLEQIVHPEVARLRAAEERKLAAQGARVVVNDIPLLFEAGLAHDFDVIVLIDAPEPLRSARIVEKRGLSEAEARRMVAAQMPAHEKRATYVIDNDGTLEELRAKAAQVWHEITEQSQ